MSQFTGRLTNARISERRGEKMNNQIGDVWTLESKEQEQICHYINELYRQATEERSTHAKIVLKKIYGNDWKTIKKRMETEGSIWYVWYMDGVNNLLRQRKIKAL